ncbi:Hsp20/alpha crystallin family protein [bacterium]|nr:Hsp20/alpha crystallin family protein [bacterium]
MSDLALKPNGTTPAADDARAATVAPRVDVLETENEFLLLADLPGVRPDAVDVRYEQGELTVHGRRHDAAPAARRPLFGEYAGSHFHRVFAVTDTVAADRIEAELKDGVLTVRLPKIEAVKPRKIAVRG